MTYNNTAEIIRRIRFEKRLTQTEMAEKVGTTKARISRIENGKNDIKYNELQSWCTKLEVSLIQFM